MAFKFVVLFAALSVCHAVPVWIGQYPNAIRDGRAPSVAFGFGSGFSSDIGGIRQSSAYGTSFQGGDASAYGSGLAGGNYASGIGIANAPSHHVVSHPVIQTVNRPVLQAVSHPVSQPGSHQVNHPVSQPASHQVNHPVSHQVSHPVSQPVSHQVSYPVSHQQATAGNVHHNYLVPAQNFGSALSSAQSHNGFGSATSSAVNSGLGRYQSAISSANSFGLGYDSAIASSNVNGLGHGSAISASQSLNGYNNYGSSVAAAENFGNYKASTAHTFQQNGRHVQESGATSVNAPGIQAANSHAVNLY